MVILVDIHRLSTGVEPTYLRHIILHDYTSIIRWIFKEDNLGLI